MIDISNVNNTLVITSDYPYAFPFEDGQLTVPVNSIAYSIDHSDYVAFRSAANNDVLFTGTIGQITINGGKVDRANFVDIFNSVAYVITAGGGEGGGSNITIDGALSTVSTNPVQNRTITNKINEIIEDINELASNPAGANIIEMTQAQYDALENKEDAFYLITDAPNPIWIGTQAEYDALQNKSNEVTYYIIEG